MLRAARAPRVRTMREFAEQEIVLPDGPYQGHKFRCSRQPFSALLFDAIDSGQWNRFVITGDQQSGKSLCGLAIPTLYHLFELRETVLLGAPDRDVTADKWHNTILPVIQQTRYARLLPTSGGGSRGGNAMAYRFSNGTTLRFMTGGGGDKSRASFTSRVLAVTETDGMDEAGGSSREADKVSQLEGRTAAFGDRSRIYMECTVSIEEGRTWREHTAGTESRIVVPCPSCAEWVTPEREHLVGWQDAEDVHAAREQAHFCCPSCGATMTDQQRREVNAIGTAKLVHRGQTVTPDGEIVGDPPRTNTCGFRWSCFNNMFKSSARIAAEEFTSAQDPDEDNADKKMCQFWWATPYKPARLTLDTLTVTGIASRQRKLPRGVAPANTAHITVGIDLGEHLCHWIALALAPDGSPHAVDYGYIEVPSQAMAVEIALPLALRQFRDDTLMHGWMRDGTDSEMIIPSMVLVDAGWQQDAALEFAESSHGIMASKGHGIGQHNTGSYRQPKTTGATVGVVGEGYHIALIKSSRKRSKLVEINVDYWKTHVHRRFQTPMNEPGAMTLFQVDHPKQHFALAKHLLAEKPNEEFKPGKGMVVKWTAISRQNHFFDCAVLACVAGHLAGVRLQKPKTVKAAAGAASPRRNARPVQRPSRDDRWKPTPLVQPAGRPAR